MITLAMTGVSLTVCTRFWETATVIVNDMI